MISKHGFAVLLATQLLAGIAVAQSAIDASAVPLAEYGRAYGGEIRILTKNATNRLSGSLGLTMSTSAGLFGTGGNGTGRGYDASVGGTIIDDRAWFFASTQRHESTLASQFGAIPANGDSRAIDAKLTAQLGERNSLVSSFRTARDSAAATPAFTAAPSSFLSLHYTGIVSSNMFFTASVSRGKTTQSPLMWDPTDSR